MRNAFSEFGKILCINLVFFLYYTWSVGFLVIVYLSDHLPIHLFVIFHIFPETTAQTKIGIQQGVERIQFYEKKTTWQISPKLDTKDPWVEDIFVCKNKRLYYTFLKWNITSQNFFASIDNIGIDNWRRKFLFGVQR